MDANDDSSTKRDTSHLIHHLRSQQTSNISNKFQFNSSIAHHEIKIQNHHMFLEIVMNGYQECLFPHIRQRDLLLFPHHRTHT